jgi:positive regulator of sigma E activity
MDEQKFCKQCSQINNCQRSHQQLGQDKSPSVAVKAIIAFLLPLLVFIGCLAVFEQIFDKTFLSLLLAISVTFGLILIIKTINKRLHKNA